MRNDDLEASITLDAAFDDPIDDGWEVCRECGGVGWLERYDCDAPKLTCDTCKGQGYERYESEQHA